MLFVRVGEYHINMENVEEFHWWHGKLYVFGTGEVPIEVNDPDKTEYKKLCESIGVRPVEEE